MVGVQPLEDFLSDFVLGEAVALRVAEYADLFPSRIICDPPAPWTLALEGTSSTWYLGEFISLELLQDIHVIFETLIATDEEALLPA